MSFHRAHRFDVPTCVAPGRTAAVSIEAPQFSRWSGLIVGVWLWTALLAVAPSSDEIPGAPQSRPIVVTGATVHTANGPALRDAEVLFDDGKIVAVGERVERPANVEVIDAGGLHLYPGLFDSGSRLGLVEIDAVRATRDFAEAGDVNPNVRASLAVNPDSELIPVTRSNGVLLAVTHPTGGLISGRGALLQLDGWTTEDLTLKDDIGMYIEWPSMAPVSEWAADEDAAQQRKDRDRRLARLDDLLKDAASYRRERQADPDTPGDLRLAALDDLLDKRLPLIAVADEVQQIQSAAAFAQRHDLRLIIYGGYDAPLCAPMLKQRKIPVIVNGVQRLPRRRSDPYDAPFTLPERLRTAGVRYCISGGGRFGASNIRNLPHHAATAAAYGLDPDEALRAITLYPAQIFGVAERVGSLAKQRDATLFLADGDILETDTHVVRAWVQGRPVDLNNRHKRLWKKYERKYQPGGDRSSDRDAE